MGLPQPLPSLWEDSIVFSAENFTFTKQSGPAHDQSANQATAMMAQSSLRLIPTPAWPLDCGHEQCPTREQQSKTERHPYEIF
jgi:hypothetical protein